MIAKWNFLVSLFNLFSSNSFDEPKQIKKKHENKRGAKWRRQVLDRFSDIQYGDSYFHRWPHINFFVSHVRKSWRKPAWNSEIMFPWETITQLKAISSKFAYSKYGLTFLSTRFCKIFCYCSFSQFLIFSWKPHCPDIPLASYPLIDRTNGFSPSWGRNTISPKM